MSEHAIELGDVIEVLKDYEDNVFDAVLCDPPYGLSFMGKRWDYDVPSANLWREVLRVCKPGAPLVAFSGTRTYHRTVVAIEDAGFEIRDCLAWMYGSGFPKSLNLEGTHEGYGTALKPAFEPAVLARKPLEGTVANNVTKWGVGALAIDACRLGREEGDVSGWSKSGSKASENVAMSGANYAREAKPDADGRWPANVLLDEHAAAILDEQTEGKLHSAGAARKGSSNPRDAQRNGPVPIAPVTNTGDMHRFGDSGGASRFFYVAKANRKERDAGCEDLPALTGGEATDREDDSAGVNNPRAGAGRTGGARNHHPTVKPIALTAYLARLLLPPNPGAILVPFAGSGSEMIGALRAGWPAVVGIERESAYVEIAQRRLLHHGRAA